MATPVSYKPSPLGYGSPRSSPFRRPQSPSSPTQPRQTTPTPSPLRAGQEGVGSRFSESPVATPKFDGRASESHEPTRDARSPPWTGTARTEAPRLGGQGTALSQLQPSQVRTLRESFQILDRDSDGIVNREDVADMLTQLGLPSSQPDVSRFFPPSAAQTMTLAAYLNSLSASLAALSPSTELLSAFSAFDDDDSGQVDIAELRDALLHTAPEPGERALTAAEVDEVIGSFTGRRTFNRTKAGMLGKRGEVFRYDEFANLVSGKGGGSEREPADDSEDD